jgi:GPH family glycoside/pentoside/hexuronide:cation symporter
VRNFATLYGTAHFGKSLIWHSSGVLFAFFLTEICAIPPNWMGWILACDMVFSAAADAGFGRILRCRVGSLAIAGRLQLSGAAVSGLLLLAFAATPFVSAPLRIGYALATCLSFRLAYSFQDIFQNAMLYLAEGDSHRRIELSSARAIGSSLAAFAVGATPSLLMSGGTDQRASHFLAFVSIIVPLWLAVAYPLYLGSRAAGSARRAALAAPCGFPPSPRQLPMGTVTLILLIMLVACSVSIFGNLLSYFAAQAFDDGSSRLAVLALIGLGNVASQPIWSWVSRRHGTDRACRDAAAVTAAGATLFFFGSARHIALAAAAGLMIEAGLGGLSMLIWASFADRVSRIAQGSLIRSPTVAMGLFTGAIKLSSALALLLIGGLLSRIDYHNFTVVTSWRLLGPMTAIPLLAGCLCLFVSVSRSLSFPARVTPHPADGMKYLAM